MPTIQQLRDQDPDLKGLNDDQVVDVMHQAYYPDLPREDVAKALGVTPPPPPPPQRTFWRSVGDAGISAVRGAVDAVEAGVGLLDIPTGGRVGKALADGVDIPGTEVNLSLNTQAARDQLGEWYSPAQKQANEAFDAAGKDETSVLGQVWEKTKAAIKNPSVLVHGAIESAPSMIGGGVVARGAAAAPILGRIAAALGPELAPAYFGALGEGVVGAGQAAEQIRQETPDKLLTGQQAALAGATGAWDTLFAIVGGKVANRLGIGDIDTMLAGAASNPKAEKHIARQVLEGFVSEGALEELPQSIGEQVMQNMATGDPLDKDVPAQAVMGFFTGGLMGGGANLYHGFQKPHEDTQPATEPGAAPAPGTDATPPAVPPTPPSPTPADVMKAPDVDTAIATALKAAGTPDHLVAQILKPDPFADVPVHRPQGATNEAQPAVTGGAEPAAAPQPAAATGASSTMFGPLAGAEQQGVQAPAAPGEGNGAAAVQPAEGGAGAPVQPGRADGQAGMVAPAGAVTDAAATPAGVPAGGAGDAAAAAAGPLGDGRESERGIQPSPAAVGGAAPASTLTPQQHALRAYRASSAIGEAEGRLRSKESDANRLALADARDVHAVAQHAIEQARQQDPAAWEAYDREQQQVAGLSVGDRVETPDGPGTVLRKFPKSWHVEVDGVGRRTLPPAALKPIAGATNDEGRAAAGAARPAGEGGQAAAPAQADRGAAPQSAPQPDTARPAGAAGPTGERPGAAPAAAVDVPRATPQIQSTETTGDSSGPSNGNVQVREGRSDEQRPLPGVQGGVHAGVAQGQPDERGAAGEGQRSELREREPAAGQADEAAVHMREPGSGNAPRGLQQAAAGDVGVPPVSPDATRGGDAAAAGNARGNGREGGAQGGKAQEGPIQRLDGIEPGKKAPLYAQRKVKNAEAILAWARGQGFKDLVAPDDLHVTIAFSRDGVDPGKVGNTSPAYEKGTVNGNAGREVKQLGDMIVLTFSSPVLNARWQQFRKAGASWDFPEYQPHISIAQAGTVPAGALARMVPYSGPIELGPELQEPLDATPTTETKEQSNGQQHADHGNDAAARRNDRADAAGTEGQEGGQAAREEGQGEAAAPVEEQTSTRRFTLSSGNRVKIIENSALAQFTVQINDGADPSQWTGIGTFKIDKQGNPTNIVGRAAWAVDDVREAAGLFAKNYQGGPKATPQVPNEPGTKYVLPSFVSGQGRRPNVKINRVGADGLTDEERAAGKKPYTEGPAGAAQSAPETSPPAAPAPAPAPAKPQATKNTIVTDDMAAAARARLKAKLARLGSGIDPEMLLDGVTLAAYHVERGARAFAAYAKAMLADLGETARPFLKSWYMGAKYDPRYAELSKEMSSAAFVDEFDLSAIPRDTGVQDGTGTATRDLESNVPAEPAGEPAAGVRADEGGRNAEQLPERSGDGLRQATGGTDTSGPAVGRGESTGAREHAAGTGAGAGDRRGDAGLRGVQSAPRADSGAEQLANAGGTRGVNSAPNLAPNPPNQLTPQQVADFTIDNDLGLGEGGQKTKFRNNIEAIRIAKDLMANPRTATVDEQRALAKYVGWGGLAQAFDASKEDWKKEYAELKDVLTPEEYEAARRSTRYAHYTSREIIQNGIYAALQRFGFTGGRVLEGGAGVGNFIGLMPTEMRTAGRVTAIEREPIAATIARALYPMQNVQQADFTEFKGDDGYYDAAVGNPPFASDPQTDRSGRKHLSGLSLHNYFFAKEVDMLRPGGILAQVVTNSFLDAAGDRARKYIADRTKFLGAIRLPNNAFSKNAGTEVTTDIIFLQKRPESEWGSKAAKDDAKLWMDVRPYQGRVGKAVNLNEYFHRNPDMMLGDFGGYGTMYGPNQPALVARPGQDTLAMLKEAVGKLPEKVYQSIAESSGQRATDRVVVALHKPPVQEGGFFMQDGKLLQRLPDVAGEAMGTELTPETQWTEKTKLGERRFAQLQSLTGMRQTLRDLLAAEIASEPKMEMLRARLNQQYDTYVKEYGLLGDRSAYTVFDDDPDFPLLLSLEHNYTPGIGPAEAKKLGIKPKKSTAVKAPIFQRRVVQKREAITRADKPEDALNISMAERGHLDAAYIGELLGKDPQDVLRELSNGERPLLFLDPATNEYVLRDAYLSGNVRQKLEQAKAAAMMVNARELEKVQPEDVPAHEITARLGAPWVPTGVYEDFAKELFGEGTAASIRYEKLNSSYATYIKAGSEVNNSNKWGTPKFSGVDLLNAIMNNRPIKVTYTDADKRVVTDVEATENANTKAQEIKDRFQDWLFADPDRSALLTRTYNDTNNNYVTRSYDGSWLTFPGKVPDDVIKFRRHQRNAIARIVQDRTALLDHVVGAGKTFTVIAANMELKRTGLANKPMVAVPNHLVKQWAADVYRLYPGANVLTASKKDFERTNRRRFLAKIATGDWDMVVIAHSSFGFIQPGAEFEAEFNQRQIDNIMAAIQSVMDDAGGDEKAAKRTIKQLEGMKERLENRIKRLRDKPMDDLLDFDELGVDQLAVDEAHLFKNLMYQTKLQNVAGLGDPAGAQRAYDMYVKTQQIIEKNGRGQGVVFATGTPVSNSLAEKYHMMRYLMPRQMEELGFQSFDAWANTYADVRQHWMQKISGDGFKAQNRMSEFVNVHELLRLFDQVADTVTNDDIKRAYREENNGAEYPLPPIKGGKPRTPVSLDKSPAQTAYMEQLAQRAAILEARKGPPKKGEDNHLSLMTDARKAAMDIRLVDLDRTEREKGGRIDDAAGKIWDRYQQWNHVKGTQLVFSDLGTPKKQAAKELKEYQRLQGIIAEATDEVRDRAAYGDERAQEIVDAADEAEKTLDEQGQDWLDAVKAALRGFSVYDDLKDALVERGIPPEQVAFIHDYETDDQKASLFRKVNAGDIRVLVGSTAKMGAGTNVQERLVALHHLDVPWRPSDVEQREGRIVRQGNRLLTEIPDFEVEVLAYVTKDTLDMRMWQIQEVKLKVINQLRTRQIERTIDNAFEDMEMSASEMQAAATGNMDLLYEIQARNEIKKLEQKARSFEAQKNDLIGRRRKVAQRLKELPGQIAEAEAQAKLAEAYKAELNDAANAFKVTIDGKQYTDVKEAQDYLLAKTEEKIYTRTVERDGKKVREEISEAEHQKLMDKVEELRKAGKPDDDAELQAALAEATSYTGRAAPIDITLNGETFTSRDKLREAFVNARGDRDPLVWKFNGQTFNRRAAVSIAIRQRVADAVADEKEADLGTVGPWSVHIEGQPKNKYGLRELDVWMTSGAHKIEGHLMVDHTVGREGTTQSRTAEELTSEVLDWANRQATNAGNGLFYLKHEFAAAERSQKELAATEDLTEWPDKAKLEAARARHQEVLQRLKAKAPANGKPALSQQGTDAEGGGRRVGELQQAMDDIVAGWQRTMPVTVVSSIDSPSVPQAVRDELAARMARGGGAGSGAVYDGVVYLFANRLASPAQAATVLYHEVLGHAGMRGNFGREFDKHLETVAMLRREDVRNMIERLGLDPRDPASRTTAAEEVLAYMAQTKPELTLVQRAVALIRSFLRAHVPFLKDMQLSDAEVIRDFILPARRHVEGGGGPGNGRGFNQGEGNRPFYSALSRSMEAVPAKALPVAGWLGAINAQINKGAVKADEVEWSGLRDWLQLQGDAKVSKQDVLDYLQKNGVRVEEVMKTDASGTSAMNDAMVRLDALGYNLSVAPRGEMPEITRASDGATFKYDEEAEGFVDGDGHYLPKEAGQWAQVVANVVNDDYDSDEETGEETRYAKYTLPGGKNYRELLLTLPVRTHPQKMTYSMGPDGLWQIYRDGKPGMQWNGTEDQVRAFVASQNGREVPTTEPYRSKHWKEENILAHIRMDDRTDADGKRVLFIEELQSDWAQQGRRKGFYDPAKPWQLFDARTGEARGNYATEAEAKAAGAASNMGTWDYTDMRHEGAPPAPFVGKTDAWLNLALKRVVKYAVDNGYERVAFVNGEQGVERYDLSKQVDEIMVERTGDRFNVAFKIRGSYSNGLRQNNVTAEKLEDMVGKEVAEKIAAAPEGRSYLMSKDLKMGGDGMRAFYDQIVPAAVNRMLPKVGGGKMGEVRIAKSEGRQLAPASEIKDAAWSYIHGQIEAEEVVAAIGGEGLISPMDVERRLGENQDPYNQNRSKPEVQAFADYVRHMAKGNRAMTQPGFDVTPAMREAASNGLPMFSQQPREPANPTGPKAPLFSQEGALNSPREFFKLAKEAVAEMHEGTPGKLHWWHKTLGTQYNLAQKSPLFKRVFDNVQDFLNDVSFYATEAANKAPKILPQLDTWRDLLPGKLGSGKKPLSMADNRAIRAPIFEGTLDWTRDKYGNPIRIDDMRERAKLMTADEKGQQMVRNNQLSPNVLKMWQGLPYEQYTAMVESRFEKTALKPGIVWTNTELANQFNLNDAQKGLYREFRDSVDQSIKQAALADMVRFVGKDGDFIRDEVMAAPSVKEGMDLLVQQLQQIQQDEPDRAAALTKTIDTLDEKARRAQELMDKGYAPLMRFGHYTVTVYGNNEETGEEEVKYFGMYESRLDARMAAKTLAQEFGDEATRIERGTMNEESYKLFAGINPETVELFGEMLGMSETGDSAADQAFQAYLKLARNNRSAMKRLIHRKGIAGFSEDVGRVLAGFTYSTSRLTSRNLNSGRIAEAVRDIQLKERGAGELARQAVRLMDYVNNPAEEGQALRGLLFAQYLGGSIASALVNMTQPFQVTMPYLSQFGGIRRSVANMGYALANAWAPTTGDKALDADLKKAVEEGVVAPQEIHQLMAQAQGRGGLRSGDGTLIGDTVAKGANFGNRLLAAWGKPFSTAELFNRRVTFVAAYRTAQQQHLANPFEFAKRAVVETQFLYNKGNRPQWARGALGATLFTFKQYSISYLEMVERMWSAGTPGSPERAAGRRAVFFAAAMILLVAGAGGLPFVEDIEDIIDGVMQRLGYNWSSKQKLRELLQGAFGKAFGGFLEQGVSGLPGAPIDVSGRMGLQNLIPGTGVFQKKKDHSSDVLEVAGAAGDLFKRAGGALSSLAEGEIGDAGQQMAPKAIRDLMKAVDMASTGQYRNDREYTQMPVDAADVAAKAIGFQPGAVAKDSQAASAAQRMVELAALRKSEIAGKWAQGIANKDTAMQQAARRELAEWNEKNPETPIKIRLQDILHRANQMQMTRAQRLEKTTPKAVRQEAHRILNDQ